MLVFASESSRRLEYILDFISKELVNKQFELTTDQEHFISYDGPRINYSGSAITEEEFHIQNVELLFETGIRHQVVTCFEFHKDKAFFKVDGGDFPFDIFAACFYLLSRYEEYLPHQKDKFGRYAFASSIAYKESFLHLPLVNVWLQSLKQALLKKYPALTIAHKKFRFLPTYDIDIAWSYKNKGWMRNIGGGLRSLLNRDWYPFQERLAVLLLGKKDPFDSYSYLHSIHEKLNLQPVYFFLLALKQKAFDKNISPRNNTLRKLIKEHDRLYSIGIHPSWQSGDDHRLFGKEIRQLDEIVNHGIFESRQHYLRFTIPQTYQKLISLGITNEYSMGYGAVNGFRASVCSPFYWYDLEKETATSLMIHPFCFMDATAFYELKLTTSQALEQLRAFKKVIKDVDGLMIALWHNNFLGTDKSFAGWREIYETFLEDVVDL